MAGADPEHARIRRLRRAIADRIAADIELLDRLGGDPDSEPSLGSLSSSWLADHYPQTIWAGGSLDDRENPECVDCDGETVSFMPIRVRA